MYYRDIYRFYTTCCCIIPVRFSPAIALNSKIKVQRYQSDRFYDYGPYMDCRNGRRPWSSEPLRPYRSGLTVIVYGRATERTYHWYHWLNACKCWKIEKQTNMQVIIKWTYSSLKQSWRCSIFCSIRLFWFIKQLQNDFKMLLDDMFRTKQIFGCGIFCRYSSSISNY